MKQLSLAVAFVALTCTQLASQSGSIYEMPRMLVYGEASMQVEADVIICWLNVYDNTYSYDYSVPYDDKKVRKQQMELIEKIGCKDYMSNPTYTGLKSYQGTGPYELKFSSKSQYEAMLAKVQANSTEELTASLDISSADISPEKKKQLMDQMLDKALVDAKAKAEKMAKSLGIVIGVPLYVEEMSSPYYYGGYEGEGGYGMYNTGMMVNVSARVQIQYELKK